MANARNQLVYRLTKDQGTPLTFRLANRHTRRKDLTYFDKDKGVSRAMRYATNQQSIFEDEQKGEIILKDILFEDGTLVVKEHDVLLKAFLDHHPDNVENEGNGFYLQNHEAEAREELERMDLEDKARDLYRELSFDQEIAVHRMIYRDTDRKESSEIRKDVRVWSRNNPIEFLNMFEDEESNMETNNVIATAIDEGWIGWRNSKKEVYWNMPVGTEQGKKLLYRVPEGDDPEESLTEFLLSNKGVDHFRFLQEQVESLR